MENFFSIIVLIGIVFVFHHIGAYLSAIMMGFALMSSNDIKAKINTWINYVLYTTIFVVGFYLIFPGFIASVLIVAFSFSFVSQIVLTFNNDVLDEIIDSTNKN